MKDGLKQILESGVAPGVVTGIAVDQNSVFAKAPKALKELESQERYKGGPTLGASGISKYMGMSTDFIRKTWAKPIKQAALLLGCVLTGFSCLGYTGQLNPGTTLSDGQTVHAQDLLNLVGNATANSALVTQQPIDVAPVVGDYVLIYSPGLGGLYRVNLQYIFNNSQSWTLLPTGTPSVFTNDFFSFYSSSNNAPEKITFTNLVLDIAGSFNPVNYLSFGATNVFILPSFPWQFSPYNTNNPAYFLTWSTNGVPYQIPFTNIENKISDDLGTNRFLGYEWRFAFAPWTLYGTNSSFTNVWGGQTNFAITAFNMFNTNFPTISDNDQFPIQSASQGNSNTTASALAIYQYITNKNALPAYTLARIQFSGTPDTMTVTNMSSVNGIVTNIAEQANWTVPTAISFSGKASQIPTVPLIQSNTLYYVLFTNVPTGGFQIYPNLTSANARTNYFTGNGVNPSANGTMYWLTNKTSFNADVIANVTGTSGLNTGIYDVYFLTPSATAFYYMTGNCLANAANDGTVAVNFESANIINTNYFRICTAQNITLVNSPLVTVLVQPQ